MLKYRFGLTLGQVFYDFSGNGRHAVSGEISSVDRFDRKSTERGIYLYGDSIGSKVNLPSNNIFSIMTLLKSTFSLVKWL
jgi:hypothetical protein